MSIRCLLLAVGLVGLGIAPAHAQCPRYSTFLYRHHYRGGATQDSGALHRPFQPGRGGAFMGLMGLRDRSGTHFLGADLEAYYWLTARWSSGLRGTRTAPARSSALALSRYHGVGRPQTAVFSLTWSNAVLLIDRKHWRLGVLAGAGSGWLNLRDQDQPVPRRGATGRCGCHTRSRTLDTSWNLISEMGLTATYKPHASGVPRLSVRGQYRTWYGRVPFGNSGQFSHYLLSVGISLPDAPRSGH